jgi:hypothetical protein
MVTEIGVHKEKVFFIGYCRFLFLWTQVMHKGLTSSDTYAFMAENDGESALFIGIKVKKQ